jgi:hypothetical protein
MPVVMQLSDVKAVVIYGVRKLRDISNPDLLPAVKQGLNSGMLIRSRKKPHLSD